MRKRIEGNPSAELLREVFSYDPATGEIRHKARRHGAKHGEIAGRIDDDGYRIISLYGRNCRAARIAWTIHYGEWPAELPDHKNTVRNDNAIDNLRLVEDGFQNHWNTKKHSDSLNPYKGITRVMSGPNEKWRAAIHVKGKTTYLGWFDNPKDAHSAYVAAALREFGEFANAG